MRLRRQVLKIARLVEYGGPLPVGHTRETLVECSRRPNRQQCLGLLWVTKQDDEAIFAHCLACGGDRDPHQRVGGDGLGGGADGAGGAAGDSLGARESCHAGHHTLLWRMAMSTPKIFAATLVQAFSAEVTSNSSATKVGEIALFRALHRALSAMTAVPGVAVDEFHGSKGQVRFQPSFGGQQRRCELCDLMVVTYREAPSFEARLTFLQAKYERRVLPASGAAPHSMKANLVQLDLLSKRPAIAGCGAFKPPSDLLQTALLDSVGSFGFFSRCATGGYELAYASADAIAPPRGAPRRSSQAKVDVPSQTRHRGSGSLRELESGSGLAAFGEGLASLEVGTPVDISTKKGMLTLKWLRRLLLEAGREKPLGHAAKRLVEIVEEHASEQGELAPTRRPDRNEGGLVVPSPSNLPPNAPPSAATLASPVKKKPYPNMMFIRVPRWRAD